MYFTVYLILKANFYHSKTKKYNTLHSQSSNSFTLGNTFSNNYPKVALRIVQ